MHFGMYYIKHTIKYRMFQVINNLFYSCKEWLISCKREDLCEKPLATSHNFRVCNKHFQNNMFTSPEKNRLLPNALPTEFGKSKCTFYYLIVM